MPDDRFNEYCEALLAQYTRRNTQTVTRLEKLLWVPQARRQPCRADHVRRFGAEGHLRDRPQRCRRPTHSEPILSACKSSLLRRAIEVRAGRPSSDRLRQEYRAARASLAVTVSYSDGTEIQILPAIRTNTGGVRIAQPGSNRRWSNVARPDDFAREARQSQHGEERQSSSSNQTCQGDGGLLHQPSR